MDWGGIWSSQACSDMYKEEIEFQKFGFLVRMVTLVGFCKVHTCSMKTAQTVRTHC